MRFKCTLYLSQLFSNCKIESTYIKYNKLLSNYMYVQLQLQLHSALSKFLFRFHGSQKTLYQQYELKAQHTEWNDVQLYNT